MSIEPEDPHRPPDPPEDTHGPPDEPEDTHGPPDPPEDPHRQLDLPGFESDGPAGESRNLPVPLSGETVAWVSPDSSPPRSSNPALAMLVASVVLAVFGLVGIGVGIGSVFFNREAPPPEIVVVSRPETPAAAPRPVQAPPTSRPALRSDGGTDLVPPVAPLDPVVEVARAVVPSVVLIEVVAGEQPDDSPEVPAPGSGDPEFVPELPEDQPRGGQGSGIVYDASGLILTNAHVVGNARAVRVQFADGTRAEGEVVGAAPAIDVALVRVETDIALTPAIFADRSNVEVGQLAVAVGSPFGLQQSVTSGIVSAVGRAVREGSADSAFVEMIQTDAPINPGNSGGALANRFGQVIGMNTLIRTDGTMGNIGLGFAIPSDIALNIAERILNGESTELGYLGVWGSDPEIGLPGAFVDEVIPGTPADEAGLMPGDLIVGIDEEPISTFVELAAKVQFRAPGTPAELEVLRDDVLLRFTLVVGVRPATDDN